MSECSYLRWDEQTLPVADEDLPADRVLALYAEHYPVDRIAEALGRTPDAVYKRLQRLGVSQRSIPWHRVIIRLPGGEMVTPYEWLRREYPSGDLDLISETLGVPKYHLYIYAHRQGWKRLKGNN